MGMRGFPSCDLVFEDCFVPDENLIIAPGGFRSLMQCFDIERCGNATMALGIATGALEYAAAYAMERKTFGKPIGERQAIQMMIADMATRVDAARLLVYRAAVNAGSGFPSIQETSMAKVFANETAKAVTDMAMEILGGYGYSHRVPGRAHAARQPRLAAGRRHAADPEDPHRRHGVRPPLRPAQVGPPGATRRRAGPSHRRRGCPPRLVTPARTAHL